MMKYSIFTVLFLALFACQTPDEEPQEVVKKKTAAEIFANKTKKIGLNDSISTIAPQDEYNNLQITIPESKWALASQNGDLVPNTALENFINKVYENTNISPNSIIPMDRMREAFSEIDLPSFIELMSHQLKFSYVISPNLKGTNFVIRNNQEKITYKEAWLLLNHIVKLNGAYLSVDQKGQLLTIRSSSDMKTDERIQFPGSNNTPSLTIAVLPLVNSKVGDILTILKGSLGVTTAAAHPNGRDIIIIDNSERIESVARLIKYLDNGGRKGWKKRIFSCQNTGSLIVAEELSDILPVLGLPVSLDYQSAERGDLIIYPIERHNALFIAVPNEEILNVVTGWAKQLDQKSDVTSEQLFIYPVKHSDAAELISVLQTFFTNSSVESSPERDRQSTSSRSGTDSKNDSKTTSKSKTNTTSNRNKKKSSDSQRKSIFDASLTLYEDTRLNRIVIRTNPRAFATVKAILKALDTPVLQTLIRVTAVEITLNDNLEFGFAHAAKEKFGDDEFRYTWGTTTDSDGNLAVPSLGGTGISALLKEAGVDDEFTFIQAVANDTDTKILNTPEILVKNHESAKIEIGQSVPYQAGTTQNSSTTETNVQYRDTGVLLEVTPSISLDNRVSLVLKQEISSIAAESLGNIDSPVFSKNLLETVLSVENGETIMIGGIIQSTKSDGDDGVPYLKDIPYLGIIFGQTSDSDQRTELVVMVTVKVINSSSSLEGMLKRYKASVDHLEEKADDLH